MNPYSALCDDFYVNMNLNTEMELPTARETVLHFFERLQKSYPSMQNFFCRENGDFVLEELKEKGNYRWAAIEPRRICSGYVNPDAMNDALEQHKLVLDLAPYLLSVSPLDCEALDLLYGFDFTYRGNHDALVAEALGCNPAMEPLLDLPGVQVSNYEPSLTLTLDESCRLQCRLSIETRTNAYQIRTGDFAEDQISVYFTARQYGSLDAGSSFEDSLDRLYSVCEEMVNQYVIAQVIRPLAQTIATK